MAEGLTLETALPEDGAAAVEALGPIEALVAVTALNQARTAPGAVAAAVLAGLAISVLPESGLRPGMRVLTPADGFPELPYCRIGLVRNPHEASPLADALAEHIVSSLDNLSEAAQAAE